MQIKKINQSICYLNHILKVNYSALVVLIKNLIAFG